MTWNVPAALHAEIGGDPGPWHRHVKSAWQASITKTSGVRLPRDPGLEYINNPTSGSTHAKVISYWSPLLQLLVFGLGWARPDAGLLRWREMGYPQSDPILRTVLRWWGTEGVLDFLGWAQARNGFGDIAATLGDANGVPTRTSEMFPMFPGDEEIALHRQTDEWAKVWGDGTDPHHLIPHAAIALEPGWSTFDPQPNVLTSHWGTGPSALTLNGYAGWYLHLIKLFDQATQEVDVIVKPIGWLGTFTRSPESGLWHRGDPHIHNMGTWST
jgi:hypothetical protein